MPRPKDAATTRSESGKKKPSKAKGKRKEPEEEDDKEVAGDMPDRDEEAEAAGERRKQKKQKKKVVEEEEEQDDAPEDEEEEDGLSKEEKEKRKLKRQRLHKKLAGYRSKAAECGYNKKGGVVAAMGMDSFASCITPMEAKRLMRFVPEVFNKSSYDVSECKERMKLSQESVPASAARETQARCEAVLRHVMNQSVLRAVEKGAQRVDAATVLSVLRPYQYNMTFSGAVPPKGLIRHAQSEGKLNANAADEAAVEQEGKDNKEMAAAAKQIDKADEARKIAFKNRKDELKAARAQAAGK